MQDYVRRFLPGQSLVSLQERVRAAVGAGIAVLIVGLVGGALVGRYGVSVALMAPVAASAVLAIAVPASPFAQPWAIFGGNVISALIGVTCAMLIPQTLVAAGAAVALAIAAMMAARCLHPPSGAVALTAVLGGPAVADLGYGFALWPVAGNSLLLVVAALLYHALTGRTYPAPLSASQMTMPQRSRLTDRLGIGGGVLDRVLKELDLFVDVDRADLETIVGRTHAYTLAAAAGATRCGDVMGRDFLAVSAGTTLANARQLLAELGHPALIVTDDEAQVVGLITQEDILAKTQWGKTGPRITTAQRLDLARRLKPAPTDIVADLMRSGIRTLPISAPLSEAAALVMTEPSGLVPVVNDSGQLAGYLTAQNVLAALLLERTARADADDVPRGRV